MITHTPKNYIRPFCLVANGVENEHVITKQSDIFYKDDVCIAFVSSHWWRNNPGNIIIISRKHYENIYDIPDDTLGYINKISKQVALAIKKTYKSDGTSLRQHNEPAGNQEVFHYHLHVFPRYFNDYLYKFDNDKRLTSLEERRPYVDKLKKYFSKLNKK
jgi:histidine triad (HIT) family protein